jgi:hypothetical protein
MKRTKKTLQLKSETLRTLDADDAARVVGGQRMTAYSCLTMGDPCRKTYSAICTMVPACPGA